MTFTLNDIKVFIPTYNRPEFLRQSIESLVKQSVGCPDITVYNNGTLQETSDVIKEFEKYGVKEVKSKGGLLECMNSVQEYIDSPYVMFFHDDDVLNSKYLEYALKALNTYENISLITTKYNEFKTFEDIDFTPAKEEHYFFSSKKQFSSYLYLFEKVAMQTAIYKTEFFKQYQRENDNYGKFFDWPYLIKMSEFGNVILFSDEMIFNVRRHSEQWTNDENSSLTVSQLLNWHKQFAEAIDIRDVHSLGHIIFYSKFHYFINAQYNGLISKKYKKELSFEDLLEKSYMEIGINENENIYNKEWLGLYLKKLTKKFHWRKDFESEITPEYPVSLDDITFGKVHDMVIRLDKLYGQTYALNVKMDFLTDMLHKPTLMQKIFSVRNEGDKKVLRILGLKFLLKRKKQL